MGDAFYLGFEVPLSRMLLRIDVECAPARGAGVKPEDPPLRWEVSCTDEPSGWAEAEVIEDLTGGFNYGSGTDHAPAPRSARLRHALRPQGLLGLLPGRSRTRSGSTGATFSHPPEISAITGAPIGALIPAAHSSREVFETVGEGDGTPGQVFELRHFPILESEDGEFLETLDERGGAWEPWVERESFVESSPPTGTTCSTSPTVRSSSALPCRTADGVWRQYGAVPPKGATLRFTRYRHGGGRAATSPPERSPCSRVRSRVSRR